ncbi:hypothetical protein ACUTQW_16415 [Serratia sp. TSA_7]|jgi:hypothetical protein|uniref:hypothetical protein n=1 Tax=Serratia sp. TSA_7 TaxID=3415659 RepID=UPI0040469C93
MANGERDNGLSSMADYPKYQWHGGGGGDGSDMNNRMTRIEIIAENQAKLMEDVRQEMIGIRSDIRSFERSSNDNAKAFERRVVDKMDENHKWVIGLVISSILVPLFIALITK